MAEVLHLLHPRHMKDQRVILRASLGLKDFQHCIGVQTVGAQTINRLRGDAQKAAGADDLRCGVQGFRRLGIQYFRIHSVSLS